MSANETELESAPAYLIVRSGTDTNRRYPLNKAVMVVGRAATASVWLHDDAISELHAKVVARDGQHWLYDLGSTNGTYVNGERITSIVLRNGDIAQFGSVVMMYRCDNLPAERGPTVITHGFAHTAMLRPSLRALSRVDDDEPLDFRRLFAFFRAHAGVIFTCTALGAAAGVAAYFVSPPPAEAKFEVSLVPDASDNPLERFERNNLEFFRAAAHHFKSAALIQRSLNALGQDEVTDADVAETQGNLTFNQVDPHTYAGSYRTDEGADAGVQFLNTHVDLYLQTEIEKALKVITAEVDFLRNQLQETETALRETETKLLAFKQEHIDGLPEQARDHYTYLNQLERRQQDLLAQLSRARLELTHNRKKLLNKDPVLEARSAAAAPHRAAMVELKRRIAEARANGLGEQHPQMVSLTAELAQLDVEIERIMEKGDSLAANATYRAVRDSIGDLEVSERVAQQELGQVARDFAKVKALVARMPEMEARYTELDREHREMQDHHARIFQKLKTSELQLELERASATARYDLISPPHVPTVSIMKALLIRLGLAAFIGFVLGVIIGGIRELRRDP